MNILITGSDGHIGRAFASHNEGKYSLRGLSLRKVCVTKIDFSGVDVVLHLSGVTPRHGIKEKQYFEINTDQTLSLARAAKSNDVRHFIFLSSVAVYGTPGYLEEDAPTINEESECHPRTPYGKSKFLAERALMRLADDDFTIAIVRPPTVYGKSLPGAMSSLIRVASILPVLPFKIDNKRSILGINNLLAFLETVIDQKAGGVFIPQDSKAISTQNIVEYIYRETSRRVILFRPTKFIITFLCLIKKDLALRLFGTLVFDSTIGNERLSFSPPYETEKELQTQQACRPIH